MTTVSNGLNLSFGPGSGFTHDAATGNFTVDPDILSAGATFTVEAAAAGSPARKFRVTVAEEVQPTSVATSFEAAGSLDRLSFIATVPPTWTQQAGFARLLVSPTIRAHGDWSGAGGDGLYRCLVRIGGGQTTAIDRRFSFGARIGLAGGNWTGIRVETFEAANGERRIHIREYTGASGTTISLATTTVGWSYDAWHWLEVDLDDATVRGRIYPEAAAAPDWQVMALTKQLGAGAAGPGGFPSGGIAPVIDIRRLEFIPAV